MKMKIIFGITVMVILAVTACNKGGSSGSANAQSGGGVPPNSESDFKVEPIDGGKSVRITGYVGDKWEVSIPSKIRDLPVTHIGAESFKNKKLTNVTIPNSVTTIEYEAFYGNQLTSVIIPNSVTTIESGAFDENPLTNVTIPNSVTTIGSGAFDENQLTSVTIGANVSLGYHGGGYYYPSFDDGFDAVYNNGKAAGTYTRPNADSNIWKKQ